MFNKKRYFNGKWNLETLEDYERIRRKIENVTGAFKIQNLKKYGKKNTNGFFIYIVISFFPGTPS